MENQSPSPDPHFGNRVPPCQEAPVLRERSEGEAYAPHEDSTGYTSRGYIEHFLPDREVNLAALNKALADVFGEPALRGTKLDLEIDEEYWVQICHDPWSGNVYKYHF
jgi:hypothetical protein